MKCKCNKEIPLNFSEKEGLHYFYCPDCKIGGKGKTEKQAQAEFKKAIQKPGQVPKTISMELTIPKNKNEIQTWAASNMAILSDRAAKFIDAPATKRMIEKNIRYVMNADLKKAWACPEGQESIVDALQESFEIGATLPEMGSIVPFGKTVEFIPAISAYEFALTGGKNPPLKEISIDCVYENDIFQMGKKEGNFYFDIEKVGFPRGEIVGVVVMATESDTGRVIGDAYDEPRLMAKAEKHSKSYQYYLQDLRLLNQAKAEGKDFFEKEITGANGKFKKKFYEQDVNNPYVGADKPEMLRKLAGKSFFAPYMKVRNARAMVDEWDAGEGVDDETIEKTVDKILDKALNQVDVADIQDADFEEIEKNKKEADEEIKDLFAD